MPKYSKIVAAMDADVEGGKLADVVRGHFSSQGATISYSS